MDLEKTVRLIMMCDVNVRCKTFRVVSKMVVRCYERTTAFLIVNICHQATTLGEASGGIMAQTAGAENKLQI